MGTADPGAAGYVGIAALIPVWTRHLNSLGLYFLPPKTTSAQILRLPNTC